MESITFDFSVSQSPNIWIFRLVIWTLGYDNISSIASGRPIGLALWTDG